MNENPNASCGVIVGNRFLECERGHRSIGYSVFYDYEER